MRGEGRDPVDAQVPRQSDVVADRIRELVRDAGLTAGDRLPSERQLVERLGVSRVIVRESLRSLEAAGTIVMVKGRAGGAVVTTPTGTLVKERLSDLVVLSALTATHVIEARTLIETGVLPLAVTRATRRDVADLRAMLVRHQDAFARGAYSATLSAEFHIRLALCSDNLVLAKVVESFYGPLVESMRVFNPPSPLVGGEHESDHRDLLDVVAVKDVPAAQSIMDEHLARVALRVRDVVTRNRPETPQPFDLPTPGSLSVGVGRVSSVVQRVRDLIRSDELRPGDRLPSERDLSAKMSVSRVTVREALRVLETSGFVSIRPGGQGGAFVASPTPGRLGADLAELIAMVPPSVDEIVEARTVVGVGIVGQVVERATPHDLDRLRAATERADDFAAAVAACTHNPAIEALVHALHDPQLGARASVPPGARDRRREFVRAVAAGSTADAKAVMAERRVRATRSAPRGRG